MRGGLAGQGGQHTLALLSLASAPQSRISASQHRMTGSHLTQSWLQLTTFLPSQSRAQQKTSSDRFH